MKKLKIIAEIGVNHNGRIEYAKELINSAKKAKADYVKFQSYITENLVDKNAPLAKYQKKKNIKNQFELLKKYELSFDEQKKLFMYAKKKNIEFISSPFDLESCENLIRLGIKTVKIPSGEITNYPLLHKVAKNFKEVFLSTGMASINEIKNAIKILKKNNTELTILHCISLYPTPAKDINLNFLKKLKTEFNYKLGFSDHSLGCTAAILSVSYGVLLIEKHITLNKNFKGPDHNASMEVEEFKLYVKKLHEAQQCLGNDDFDRPKLEKQNKKIIRKSIYANKNILKGEKFSANNLITKRPDLYLSANYWCDILGKKSKKIIKKGQPILKTFF